MRKKKGCCPYRQTDRFVCDPELDAVEHCEPIIGPSSLPPLHLQFATTLPTKHLILYALHLIPLFNNNPKLD